MGNENTKLCENCRDVLIGSALGMTLRDYFAAKAVQGLLANPGGPIQANGMSGWGWCNCTVEGVAEFAWYVADAMLRARERQPRQSVNAELLEAAKIARDALAAAIKVAWEGSTDADVAERAIIKKLDSAIARATGQEG